MSFDANSFQSVGTIGGLEESTPVTLGGSSGQTDLATYNPALQALGDTRTIKQFQRAGGDSRPVVIFFFCRVIIPNGKMCGCELMRRMAFSDARTAAHVGNFRWMELDVDDARNADLMQRYNVQSSPTLVFCDGMGNEIKRSVGAQQAGGLIESLTSTQGRCETAMARHDRVIADMNAQLAEGWRLYDAGDMKGAIREFRRLQTQANRNRYREFLAEVDRAMDVCREQGIARVRQVCAQGGEDVLKNLNVLRGEFPGVREVGQAIDEAVRNLRNN